MRWALWVTLVIGCSGSPAEKGPAKPDLPDGSGVYRARYNPPPCLTDRPNLHVEIETPAGWERVALEGDEGPEIVDEFLEGLRAEPTAEHQIEGRITGRRVAWLGGHASRVLVVRVIDPELEAEAEADPNADAP